jgi:hypothetical protein
MDKRTWCWAVAAICMLLKRKTWSSLHPKDGRRLMQT